MFPLRKNFLMRLRQLILPLPRVFPFPPPQPAHQPRHPKLRHIHHPIPTTHLPQNLTNHNPPLLNLKSKIQNPKSKTSNPHSKNPCSCPSCLSWPFTPSSLAPFTTFVAFVLKK